MGLGRWHWILMIGVMAALVSGVCARQLDSGRDDATEFADVLVKFVNKVRADYVREVSREDLLVASMTGLYQSVNKPVPERLRDEIAGARGDELLAVLRKRKSDLGSEASIRGRNAFVVCTNSMQKVLDPYCGIVSARDFGALSESLQFDAGVAFAQIPIPEPAEIEQIQQRRFQPRPPRGARAPEAPRLPDQLIVKTVIPGGPAQKAGLRPGDRIIAIDNAPCSTLNYAYFREVFYLQDAESRQNTHSVRYVRPGQPDAVTVSIAVESYMPENVYGARRLRNGYWDWFLEGDMTLGYIRISQVNTGTATDFHSALETMRLRDVKGIILDLRWCTGGFLTSVLDVAHGFVERDPPAALTLERDSEVGKLVSPPPPIRKPLLEVPVAVLIGSDTTGGGEMIAAALQDLGRAITIGDRTAGKGSVQRTIDPNPLAQYFMDMNYKVTTGMLQRPGKKNLQRYPHSQPTDDWGVRPDAGRWIPVSRELNQQLREWWLFHALRPTGDHSPLPVDDPEADPQLAAAIKMLKVMVK